MSTTNLRLKESAAAELAWWLRAARRHIAQTRPRVCCDCAYCFVVSSASSPLRCWRCGLAAAGDDVPTENPDVDSTPQTEGPSPL